MTSDWQELDWGPDDDEEAAEFWPAIGGAEAVFPRVQAVIIRSLVSQLAERIGAEDDAQVGETDELEAELGLSGSAEPPDDPVLARLLPGRQNGSGFIAYSSWETLLIKLSQIIYPHLILELKNNI